MASNGGEIRPTTAWKCDGVLTRLNIMKKGSQMCFDVLAEFFFSHRMLFGTALPKPTLLCKPERTGCILTRPLPFINLQHNEIYKMGMGMGFLTQTPPRRRNSYPLSLAEECYFIRRDPLHRFVETWRYTFFTTVSLFKKAFFF